MSEPKYRWHCDYRSDGDLFWLEIETQIGGTPYIEVYKCEFIGFGVKPWEEVNEVLPIGEKE